jgi:MFS family permease
MTLWRHRDFMKLWTGQTISVLGTELSALSFLAILVLQATPLQMGFLGACASLPALLVGLQAGVWVDRLRRRPLMIASDLGRFALLLSVPLAAAIGRLHIEQLYVVAFFSGALTVLFQVAYRSLLPSLVGREQIMEGNSKLATSDAISEIGGQAIGGGLVQAFSAQVAVVCDAATFLVSALTLGLIRTPEPQSPAAQKRQSVRHEAAEGIRVVLRNPLLRATTLASVTQNLFGNIIGATYSLFVLRELRLPPVVLGCIVAAGAVSGLAGSLFVGRIVRRFGIGMAILGAAWVHSSAQFLTPFARGPAAVAVALLVLAQLTDISWTVYNVNEMSLRQSVVPDRLLGRANASIHVLKEGVRPIGLLGGGILAQIIGLRPALTIAAVGLVLSTLWIVFSPVRTLKELPLPVADVPEAAV